MKARRFLAYIAAAVVSICFVVGCSDKDEPPMNPDIEDQEVGSPSYNDTIIYIDESSDEERSELLGGCGLMTFTEESLDGYRVIVTKRLQSGSYEIYIPADGTELDLEIEGIFNWFEVSKYCEVGDDKIYLDEQHLGYYESKAKNEKRYFYIKSNRFLTITHDTLRRIRFAIPANTSTDERVIKTSVWEGNPSMCGAEMIFIQAGAEKK